MPDMNSRKLFYLSWVISLVAVLAFTAGYFTHRTFFNQKTYPLLEQANSILQKHALEDLPEPPALEYGMIQGMVQAYGDPYTSFIEPAQHELQSNNLAGEFGGIGARLETNSAGEVLLYPLPESPALQAGLQDADRLIAVDSLQIESTSSSDQIQAAIRGPVGKTVEITILRETQKMSFSVRRASFPIPSVTWNIDPDDSRLGNIKVTLFSSTTADEIIHAAGELSAQGATHYVLDLRDNPGGLLTAGVAAARIFLSDGVVIEQQYRGRDIESYEVTQKGDLAEIPLVVLVNHGTASAAEILAGALQAHERAVLIGQTTFGKDTLQLVFELADGSSLHVTAARWWVPGLEPPIQGHGLLPDYPIAADAPGPRPELPVIQAAFFASR